MAATSPRQVLRRTNLGLVMAEDQVGGPTGLARLLGTPAMKGHLSNISAGRRGMGDGLASKIEMATGKPSGWMDQQHPLAGEDPGDYKVAQELSHAMRSHELPLISWETIMNSAAPEVFRAILPDNALAPDYPMGTEIVWTTRRRVLPDRLVLVRDRHGQLHARQCHQGRAPGHWIAAAINPSYVNFDFFEDELTLVAVYKGRLEPDDT